MPMAELLPADLVIRLRDIAGKYDEYGWHDAIELEAADEIERLRTEREWRPIDTAPPGEKVLLWFNELGYPVVGDHSIYAYKMGGWIATHWMPLPSVPQG
jgi:hypothetical protein